MYLYCASPYGKLKSNFIKVGICSNIESLKCRYSTYYGSSFRYYYIVVDDKKAENNIHKELKDLGLHIENELFIYNDVYDFYYYTKILNKFNVNENLKSLNNNQDLFNIQKYHILDFIIYIFKNTIKKYIFYFKKDENKYWKYYEKTECIIFNNETEFEKIWTYYRYFCDEGNKYYKSRNRLKDIIRSIIPINGTITYKGYVFENKGKQIRNISVKEISFETYILKKYDLIVEYTKKYVFEKYLDEKDNIKISKKRYIRYF